MKRRKMARGIACFFQISDQTIIKSGLNPTLEVCGSDSVLTERAELKE
jgi:hypothetical protein